MEMTMLQQQVARDGEELAARSSDGDWLIAWHSPISVPPGKMIFFELFGQGARLVFAGLTLGVAAAGSRRGIVSPFVFGVTTGDPLTYLFAALTFSGVALVAVILPARRAPRIEVIRALRFE